MKKAVYNRKGEQVVETGWKEFDRQTNCICTGNVYANTQVSSFIRPWMETKCNGFDFKEGELMNSDLQQFRGFHIPEHIKKRLRDKERTRSFILYMFFTSSKRDGVKPFLWVLTDYDYTHIADGLTLVYGQHYAKRCCARDEILQYITK